MMKTRSTSRLVHQSGSRSISPQPIGGRMHTSNGVTVAVKMSAAVVTLSHRCMKCVCGSSVARLRARSWARTRRTCAAASCCRSAVSCALAACLPPKLKSPSTCPPPCEAGASPSTSTGLAGIKLEIVAPRCKLAGRGAVGRCCIRSSRRPRRPMPRLTRVRLRARSQPSALTPPFSSYVRTLAKPSPPTSTISHSASLRTNSPLKPASRSAPTLSRVPSWKYGLRW